MNTITLDGLNEEEFRRSIEMRLRHDLAGAALERLRGLIALFAGPGGILPERFLTVTSADLNLYGWDGLADALHRHDRPGRPVTALSIAFGWPGEESPVPDADGRLNPLIETGYYTDDSFPFSVSAREDLLDGYSYHGCTWADDCEATESTLSLGGIDDLHGALAILEARLLESDEPDDDGIRAGSLGACLLSVLLYQAVSDRIVRDGLPRPLCVMAGSNGVYPYFDAPVAGMPEDARKAAEAAEEDEVIDRGVPGPRYSSLLVTGIPRAKKRAVLVLQESAEEMEVRIASLRGINHREGALPPPALPAAASADEPPVGIDPETTIIPVVDGPLMTKKAPGQSWDFRDMLGPPRDAEPPHGDLSFEPPSQPEPESPEGPPAALTPDRAEPQPGTKPPVADLPFEAARPADPADPVVPAAEQWPATPEPAQTALPQDPEPLPETKPAVADLPFETAGPGDPPVPPGEPEPDEPEPPLAQLAPLLPRLPDPVGEAAPRPRFPSQPPVGPGFAFLEPSLQIRLESLLAPHVPELRPSSPAPEPEPAGLAAEDPVTEPASRTPELGPVWPFGIDWLEEEAAYAAEPDHEPVPAPTLWSRLRAWLGRR
ncbi:hypothetical protein [Novosphingobium sp.]|uniref:hypothetical protein n=1 Tax=Novosphingobium sp. TaxID=1874826 RepID=UPI0025D37423|nr:hypothetical protein [Novosphingobium sp.]